MLCLNYNSIFLIEKMGFNRIIKVIHLSMAHSIVDRSFYFVTMRQVENVFLK